MSDILDKARQVAADALRYTSWPTTSMEVQNNTPSTGSPALAVCVAPNALHAANLLTREPKKLTEDEKQAMARKLVARSIGDPARTSSRMADCLDYGDWLLRMIYPDYAAMEKRIKELESEIAEGDYWKRRATQALEHGQCPVCFGGDEGGHTEVCPWGELEIKLENSEGEFAEVEAPLREEIAELKATNDTQASKIRAIVAVAEKHGWNGVENSKILETFLDDLITEQVKEIKRHRGELATAWDAREKRVCDLMFDLPRKFTPATIQLYRNRCGYIVDSSGDQIIAFEGGLSGAIAALEKLVAEKHEPTAEETDPLASYREHYRKVGEEAQGN